MPTSPVFLPHPGRPSGVVDGPDEVRKRVRELVRAGADVIKVATSGGVLSSSNPHHGQLRDAEIATMTEEAAAAGIHVMAHAQAADGIKAALRNGVRSIEHGIFLDDEAIELMLQKGAWLVPTLQAPRGSRAVIAAAESGASIPHEQVKKARMLTEVHVDAVRHAHEAGVKIAMGRPSRAHDTNLEEDRADGRRRAVPTRGVHATAASSGHLLDVADDRGTIRPGQRADLAVVDGSRSIPEDVARASARGCARCTSTAQGRPAFFA